MNESSVSYWTHNDRIQVLRTLDKWHRLGSLEVCRLLEEQGLSPEQTRWVTHDFPVSDYDAKKA
jgi:hypothetical protein